MSSYSLEMTSHFSRALRRFKRKHPELRRKTARILRDIENDPYQPHLQLHPLSGNMEGMHAVRINYQHRIALTLIVSAKHIILVDIGSHDEVYR